MRDIAGYRETAQGPDLAARPRADPLTLASGYGDRRLSERLWSLSRPSTPLRRCVHRGDQDLGGKAEGSARKAVR